MMKAKTAGISSDAVAKATGKTWEEWHKLLDADGCKKMTHKEIVAVVGKKHKVGPWWQQMVTVGYEQARGLRVMHETTRGFSVSRSKTLPFAVAVVYAAWNDKRQRAQWLADPDFTIRRATEHRSLCITWIDGKTNVDVMFYDKGNSKCQVTVQHDKLASNKEAARMKVYWGEQLDKLKTVLEK